MSTSSVSSASFIPERVEVSSSALGGANGCGGGGTWWLIPDTPFLDACNAHDLCYTTTYSKHHCDTEFLKDMLSIVDYKASLSNITQAALDYEISEALAKAILRQSLIKMAEVYHAAVVEFGGSAYCESTQRINAPECGGTGTGEFLNSETIHVSNPPSQTNITATCQLWKFPDGNGSYYYMLTNCVYATVP